MYPPPKDSLDEATVRQLDDQYFTSDPYAYIRARISSLLTDAPKPLTGALAESFIELLGPSAAFYTTHDERVTTMQTALDAFALRHQVAETLLRFLHTVLHHQDGQSHWVELIDTPFQTREVYKQNHSRLSAEDDDGEGMLRTALLPPGFVLSHDISARDANVPFDERSDDELVAAALNLHVAWINYAIQLFAQESPDLNAAHNKFKHGMGVRPQDDVLMTLTHTPPSPDGGYPLSALTDDDAIDLFDGINTEFLARPTPRHGLEATQIAMSPAPSLVEAAAMAHTLALLIHTAAAKHFADHTPHEGRSMPPFPGILVDGPVPGTLRPTQPFALRFPLTTPEREGGTSLAEWFWTHGQVLTLKFGERMEGLVVTDDPDNGPVDSVD